MDLGQRNELIIKILSEKVGNKLHFENIMNLAILKEQSKKMQYKNYKIDILSIEIELRNVCLSYQLLDIGQAKKIFREFIKLAKIQAKRRMVELRASLKIVLLFILSTLQKILKPTAQIQAYQTPPTKLFTQSITHYTHTLSRP